jgi:hypothetical protein
MQLISLLYYFKKERKLIKKTRCPSTYILLQFYLPMQINVLNITITVLDIIHRLVLYLKTRRFGDLILSLDRRLALSIGPI